MWWRLYRSPRPSAAGGQCRLGEDCGFARVKGFNDSFEPCLSRIHKEARPVIQISAVKARTLLNVPDLPLNVKSSVKPKYN